MSTRRTKLLRRAALAVALATASAGLAFVVSPVAALAQAALAPAQEAQIQQQLQAAIAAVNAQQFASDADKQTALATAIAGVVTNAVTPGSDALGITAIVIALASDAGVPAATIGRALGQSAIEVARRTCEPMDLLPDAVPTPLCTDSLALASAIAQAVANEGAPDLAQAFAAATNIGGTPTQLAAIALGVPRAAAEIGPGIQAGIAPQGFQPVPCNNPSCI
jgi:hypothetical protein